MDGWNTSLFPFGARPIFRGKLAVSFREGSQIESPQFDIEKNKTCFKPPPTLW